MNDEDATVIACLDSADAILRLRDVLNTQLAQGWIEMARARYSMGHSRINESLFSLRAHRSLVCVSEGELEIKPSGSAQEEEEEDSSDDEVVVRDDCFALRCCGDRSYIRRRWTAREWIPCAGLAASSRLICELHSNPSRKHCGHWWKSRTLNATHRSSATKYREGGSKPVITNDDDVAGWPRKTRSRNHDLPTSALAGTCRWISKTAALFCVGGPNIFPCSLSLRVFLVAGTSWDRGGGRGRLHIAKAQPSSVSVVVR
ncbi:uncharacterized protein LOC112344802 isoform X3 [Selaginella moellendorffii]|uniref:uncharacterized protein LOC112344802 isoform X3 n=1 Tax=Selaginella moellendorffii TaxID=88036 RepID=UPI000D1C2F57|nr:uncharacterized protein LOC112344802 isoform X3 [Selaginella moellendorffii]|eukprot:XP_024525926.1 uncharacterized protein LOC112344802 isoform X3 [Selaginella moellendorffii]